MPNQASVTMTTGFSEGVGFEPTDPCGSPVFKTGAIDHSAIPPDRATPLMPRQYGLANDLGFVLQIDPSISPVRDRQNGLGELRQIGSRETSGMVEPRR